MESFRSMLLNVGAKDNSFSTYRRERLEDEQQAIGMETKVDGAEQEDPAEYGNSVGLVLRRSLNQKRCLLYLVLGALFLLVIGKCRFRFIEGVCVRWPFTDPTHA
ncbi:hypothetical protein chiPu_0025042 [Chiloscyllium punctatum]|uniref:Uncharacterized protein n=1 Tax=Chiloscyllium punctatum TaxID=137246 RepID=A0A401TFV6_CHIPU|nr:hypothetical protein [Chiloscyllium punctatum]